VPSISIVISRPVRRSRIGTNRVLDFVLHRARQWPRDIEECGEPGRPQMDIDLIGPDIDVVDQGGQEGTLAGSGQLGPALADFPGARDLPALR